MSIVQPFLFDERNRNAVNGRGSIILLESAPSSVTNMLVAVALGLVAGASGLTAIGLLGNTAFTLVTALVNETQDIGDAIVFPIALAIITGIISFNAGRGFASLWRDIRDSERLVKQGRLIRGEVVSARIEYGGEDENITSYFTLYLDYRLRTPAGRELTGQKSQLYMRVSPDKMPQSGVPLAALYLNDNLYHVL
jgi:hypothetical protein